uniref:Mucin-5AC n=1 Tax=Syphacia muris TaxID=451379 RepID=A0A0N5AWC9_9BILA
MISNQRILQLCLLLQLPYLCNQLPASALNAASAQVTPINSSLQSTAALQNPYSYYTSYTPSSASNALLSDQIPWQKSNVQPASISSSQYVFTAPFNNYSVIVNGSNYNVFNNQPYDPPALGSSTFFLPQNALSQQTASAVHTIDTSSLVSEQEQYSENVDYESGINQIHRDQQSLPVNYNAPVAQGYQTDNENRNNTSLNFISPLLSLTTNSSPSLNPVEYQTLSSTQLIHPFISETTTTSESLHDVQISSTVSVVSGTNLASSIINPEQSPVSSETLEPSILSSPDANAEPSALASSIINPEQSPVSSETLEPSILSSPDANAEPSALASSIIDIERSSVSSETLEPSLFSSPATTSEPLPFSVSSTDYALSMRMLPTTSTPNGEEVYMNLAVGGIEGTQTTIPSSINSNSYGIQPAANATEQAFNHDIVQYDPTLQVTTAQPDIHGLSASDGYETTNDPMATSTATVLSAVNFPVENTTNMTTYQPLPSQTQTSIPLSVQQEEIAYAQQAPSSVIYETATNFNTPASTANSLITQEAASTVNPEFGNNNDQSTNAAPVSPENPVGIVVPAIITNNTNPEVFITATTQETDGNSNGHETYENPATVTDNNPSSDTNTFLNGQDQSTMSPTLSNGVSTSNENVMSSVTQEPITSESSTETVVYQAISGPSQPGAQQIVVHRNSTSTFVNPALNLTIVHPAGQESLAVSINSTTVASINQETVLGFVGEATTRPSAEIVDTSTLETVLSADGQETTASEVVSSTTEIEASETITSSPFPQVALNPITQEAVSNVRTRINETVTGAVQETPAVTDSNSLIQETSTSSGNLMTSERSDTPNVLANTADYEATTSSVAPIVLNNLAIANVSADSINQEIYITTDSPLANLNETSSSTYASVNPILYDPNTDSVSSATSENEAASSATYISSKTITSTTVPGATLSSDQETTSTQESTTNPIVQEQPIIDTSTQLTTNNSILPETTLNPAILPANPFTTESYDFSWVTARTTTNSDPLSSNSTSYDFSWVMQSPFSALIEQLTRPTQNSTSINGTASAILNGTLTNRMIAAAIPSAILQTFAPNSERIVNGTNNVAAYDFSWVTRNTPTPEIIPQQEVVYRDPQMSMVTPSQSTSNFSQNGLNDSYIATAATTTSPSRATLAAVPTVDLFWLSTPSTIASETGVTITPLVLNTSGITNSSVDLSWLVGNSSSAQPLTYNSASKV